MLEAKDHEPCLGRKMDAFQNRGSFQEAEIVAQFSRVSYPVTRSGKLRNDINYCKIPP